MKNLLIVFIALVLSGCTLFEGRGKDGSMLTVKHRCDVELDQNAKVSGMDDADVIETVEVSPDCTATINFRQTVGDTVKGVEGQGAQDVMGSTQNFDEDTNDGNP